MFVGMRPRLENQRVHILMHCHEIKSCFVILSCERRMVFSKRLKFIFDTMCDVKQPLNSIMYPTSLSHKRK